MNAASPLLAARRGKAWIMGSGAAVLGLAAAIVLLVTYSSTSVKTVELQEEMLLPLNLKPDVNDIYTDPAGGYSYHNLIHKRTDFGNGVELRKVQPDRSAAWYAGWWNKMRMSEVVDGVEHMTGIRNFRDGKTKLVDAGINVDGWEPGRNRRQIVHDERTGKALPHGFWKDDGTAVYEPDTAVHHPCGSPLRERPCEDENEEKKPAAKEEKEDNKLWKDPMPVHVLEKYHAEQQAAIVAEKERAANQTAAHPH